MVTLEWLLRMQCAMTFWKCCTYTQQKKKHSNWFVVIYYFCISFLEQFIKTPNLIWKADDFRFCKQPKWIRLLFKRWMMTDLLSRLPLVGSICSSGSLGARTNIWNFSFLFACSKFPWRLVWNLTTLWLTMWYMILKGWNQIFNATYGNILHDYGENCFAKVLKIVRENVDDGKNGITFFL